MKGRFDARRTARKCLKNRTRVKNIYDVKSYQARLMGVFLQQSSGRCTLGNTFYFYVTTNDTRVSTSMETMIRVRHVAIAGTSFISNFFFLFFCCHVLIRFSQSFIDCKVSFVCDGNADSNTDFALVKTVFIKLF